ncbi:hypothetical protein C3V36_03445 [Lachnospiraceae bacterium oral taxon 500]|nr:hypothetical protein C3V36_03445 [Lachnospiraceae bacterium oral taxon 500]
MTGIWKKSRIKAWLAETGGQDSEKRKPETAGSCPPETKKGNWAGAAKGCRFWHKNRQQKPEQTKAAGVDESRQKSKGTKGNRAKLRLTAKEKVIFYAAGGAVVLLLGWLFFESLILGALLLPVLVFTEERAAEEMEQRRKQKWEEDFGKYLTELDSQIRLGRSLESGMSEALRGGGLFAAEDWIVQKLEMNVSAADIFSELAEKKPMEGLKYFTAALESSLQSGGNLHELMQNSLIQIQKKLQMEKEISSMLTKVKYESRLLTLFVPFLLLYLKALSPNFRQVMYQTLQGRMVMGVCLGIYLLAAYLCYSMTQIEI